MQFFMSMRRAGAVAVLTGCLLGASPAVADTFTWSYSGVAAPGDSPTLGLTSVTGFGQFTATLISGEHYQINTITGFETDDTGTFAIAGLSPYAGADNTFFVTPPQVDFAGFSFSLVGSGTLWNIFFNPGSGGYFANNSVDNPVGNATPSIAINFQAVPGPVVGAGLPGLALACSGLIALARRRRRRNGFGAVPA
jgi:hypothetical protein